MRVTLTRHSYHPAATLGMLRAGDLSLHTIERPWRRNERRVSCIPEGTYPLRPYNSPKFQNCFQVCDVPGRDYILIHAGNTADDVEGCIAVGLKGSQYSLVINQSQLAMQRLRQVLAGIDDCTIEITFDRSLGLLKS